MNTDDLGPYVPDDQNTYGDEEILLYSKFAFIFFVFTATMVSSYLPWIIHKKFSSETSSKIISVGCCFTAGIIIGAGFSHLLPDAIDTWEDYFIQQSDGFTYKGYPWASLLSIFAMFVLLWIDKVFVDKGVEGEGGDHNHNHMVIDMKSEKHDHKHKHKHNEQETHHRHAHSISIIASDEPYYNDGDRETEDNEAGEEIFSQNKDKKSI